MLGIASARISLLAGPSFHVETSMRSPFAFEHGPPGHRWISQVLAGSRHAKC
jgi:hypothetical protein